MTKLELKKLIKEVIEEAHLKDPTIKSKLSAALKYNEMFEQDGDVTSLKLIIGELTDAIIIAEDLLVARLRPDEHYSSVIASDN
jgi:Ca2+-dependent lipid-binding protein